jgi:phosphoglucosamine mutase
MSAQLFGTDGIRGPAGTYPLNDEGMVRIGKAAGAYFTKPGDKVAVGWDPRESSEGLVNSVVAGLTAMGADVSKVGVIPTPGLAFLSKQEDVAIGVMITASHNPYTDNGVKIFTPEGRKLPDKDQSGLNDLIGSGVEPRGHGTVSDDPGAIAKYEDFLVASADGTGFQGLKLAVDSANGASSGIAARVFSRLGADVIPLFDKPDGRNINVRCGATDTNALQEAVMRGPLDAGVALDGDADRVVIIDGQGRELTGDHILYILAVTGKHKGIAATIMSNMGMETALMAQGIEVKRTPVGDRAVLACLDETGYSLGGEQSGHIIMREYNGTGDGLLAAIRTLAEVIRSGRTLAWWRDELKLLPQSLVSVPFPDKSALEREQVKKFIADQSDELGGNGRLNVRASGTEPKVRIMVEAPDAEVRAREIANKLKELAT